MALQGEEKSITILLKRNTQQYKRDHGSPCNTNQANFALKSGQEYCQSVLMSVLAALSLANLQMRRIRLLELFLPYSLHPPPPKNSTT